MSDDQARKDRIMRHMNADHADSLAAYARHFASVPEPEASGAQMIDVSFNSMTISVPSSPNSTHTRTVTVPIDPPLKTWNDARERLKQMSEIATADDVVQVTRFVWPTPFGWIVAILVCISYYTFWYPELLARGSIIRKYYLQDIHVLADLLMEHGAKCWWIVLGIHTFETGYLWATRLRKYCREKCGWGTRILWMMGTMTEGFGTFLRFDKEVKDVKAKGMKIE